MDNLETVVTPEGLNGGYWVIRKALDALKKTKYLKPLFYVNHRWVNGASIRLYQREKIIKKLD